MDTRPDPSHIFETAFSMSRVPEENVTFELAEIALLVQRTVAGDSSAFEKIVMRHERRVLTLALRLLGTMEDAQDAAQEIFLRAFKYIHRLEAGKPVEPWLVGITVNVCRDIGRKRNRRRMTFSDAADCESISIDSRTPQASFEGEQERRILRNALERLPEKERMALILRDVEGFSTAEVALALGSSEGTVRSQISRGRVRLREVIDDIMGGR